VPDVSDGEVAGSHRLVRFLPTILAG
jgi:hypothetical protein